MNIEIRSSSSSSHNCSRRRKVKASQTGVSQTGFSKKVLEQVRDGLRISLQGKKGLDFGDFARWAILKKHVIPWLLVAFKLCFFF